MSYNHFAATFSNSRKNHPWLEVDYILGDMKSCNFSSILDIGCGNGRFLEEAHKKNIVFGNYLGIDSSMGMIQEAERLHPDEAFKVQAMQDLPDTLGMYDAIIMLASFHHLELQNERHSVLNYIRRFLRSGGRIYMTNWNLQGQERYKKNHLGNGDFRVKIGAYERYYHGFTVGELEELFVMTGYKIMENRVFQGGRNILSVLSIS